MKKLDNIVVILVQPESPGNVGFVTRSMANFGVSRLRIVGPDMRRDNEAQKLAMHAVDILEAAEVFPDLQSALIGIDEAWATTARTAGTHSVNRVVIPLNSVPDPTVLDGDVALVFGRESHGLTNAEIAACDLTFTIPVSDQYRSLNLSHAVAVVLYELFARFANVPDTTRGRARAATREEKELVCKFFDHIVDCIPLIEHRRPIAKRVFRNIIGRAYLTGREVTTMTGTVRKILERVCMGDQQDKVYP